MPDVLDAVQTWNAPSEGSPHVYNIADTPTRLDWSPLGEPVLVSLAPQHCLVILSQAARWDRAARRKDEPRVAAIPPRAVIDALRAEPATFWPELRRFVAAPFFRPDGTLVVSPGYDLATRLYYVPQPALTVPPISRAPSDEERHAAVAFLCEEVLIDFCFRDRATDLAHAIAGMVTPFMRPFYRGHTPLFAISKPVERAGAGLLTDVVLYASLGRRLPRTSLSGNAEEVKKTLFAFAREGTDALLFDNVNGALDQSPLASFLTSDRLRDRVLGFSATATAEGLPLLYVTGIGITYSTELTGRICLIELDPGREHPEERSGFRHSDLRAFVEAEQGRLIWACCTLIQAAAAQGWPQPPDRPILGDFQGWADAVGSVLHVASLPGFLRNRPRLRGADPTGDAWRLLARRARERFLKTADTTVTQEFTAGMLWPLTGWKREERERVPGGAWIPDPDVPRFLEAPDVPLPLGLRESGSDKGLQTAFGIALSKRVGQVLDGWRLEYVGDDHNAKVYQYRLADHPAWVTDASVADDAGGAADGA
jgi:hypothetical protein